MTRSDATSPAVVRTVGVTPLHTPSPGPGLVLAALVLAVYGGLSVSVDFARAKYGIQSDEATYYMMARSLAHDGDLAFAVCRPPAFAPQVGSVARMLAEHQHPAAVVDAPHPQATKHVLAEQERSVRPSN